MCILIFLFVILAAAAITDMCFGRIYNGWIFPAMAIGLSYAAWRGGIGGLAGALFSMAVPVFLLYPLFMIGGMGAGDIKLLAAVGCFLTVRETVTCLGISFCIGAIFSLVKMLVERSFLRRMKYLLSYLLDAVKSGRWKRYGENMQEDTGKRKTEGKIHFALPVLLGVLLYKGGIYF